MGRADNFFKSERRFESVVDKKAEMENEQRQIAGYYFAGQETEQAKVLQLYEVNQPSNVGSKDFLAMALCKLATDKRESFFKILQRAEQELEKEFRRCEVHSG